MGPYLKKLRMLIGKHKIIHPGARIIIENKNGEILFIWRKDNGKLGLPAGGLEENETIEECIRREVKEETGLHLHSLQIIGISSSPDNETVQYPNGDIVQYFTIEFFSNKYSGDMKTNDPDEIQGIQFLCPSNLNKLPKIERSILKSLNHYFENQSVSLR